MYFYYKNKTFNYVLRFAMKLVFVWGVYEELITILIDFLAA